MTPAPGRRWARSILLTLGACAISAALIALLTRWMDLDRVLHLVMDGSAPWMLLGILPILCTISLRAMRLACACGEAFELSWVRTTAWHAVSAALIPAKLGEAALPVLLTRVHRMAGGESVLLLLVLRVIDLVAIVGFLATTAGLWFLHVRLGWPFLAALVVVLSSAGGLAFAAYLLIRALPLQRIVGPGRVGRRLQPVWKGLSSIGSRRPLRLGCFTLLLWTSLFTAFYCYGRAFGTSAGWWASAFEGAAASFAFALPLNGIANLGPFETAWVAVGALFHVSTEAAMAAALGAHLAVIVVTVLTAAVASVLVRGVPRTAPPGVTTEQGPSHGV